MDAVAIFIGGLVAGLAVGVGLVRYGMGLAYRIEDDVRNERAPLEDLDDVELEQTHTDGSIVE